jgi:hypothetical protein
MTREIIIGVWFWGDLIIIKTDQEVCALSGEKSPMPEVVKQPSHFFRASQSSALPPHGQGGGRFAPWLYRGDGQRTACQA